MSNTLYLPQLQVQFGYELPEKQTVLVAGGTPPEAEWLKKTAADRTLWCADHGVDVCKSADCLPYRLIGDADSASPDGWQWAIDSGALVTKVPAEKDLTDTQLALQMIASEYKSAVVVLTGAWGGRFDHAFSTIFSLQGFSRENLRGCIADQKEVLLFLHDEDYLTLRFNIQPKAISLLPLSGECSGVSINGVHWPLDQVMLNNNLPYAVSNEVSSKEDTIWVSLKKGLLGVYLYWGEN